MLRNLARGLTRRKCTNMYNFYNRKTTCFNPNLTFSKGEFLNWRNFAITSLSTAKIFVDTENTHAFNVVNHLSVEKAKSVMKPTNSAIDSSENFEEFLSRNWRSTNIDEIVQGFHDVLNYCVGNNIDISDPRFDKITDGLLDHVQELSDEQLASLLVCIKKFPPCESYESHNYHDIWSALDDVCLWKMSRWDIDRMFYFASLWYHLHLGRLCDFTDRVIQKCTRRAPHLSKNDLVHVFFYINVLRRGTVDFSLEAALEKKVHEMNADELGVIALGYFKSKSKIKLPLIAQAMIDRLIEEHKTVSDVTIAAILKILRYSGITKHADKIYNLMEELTVEVDRMNNLCCLHLALLGTTMQIFHEKSLVKITEKIVKDITNPDKVRLKEIERLLMALTMFNVNPKTEPNIFEAALRELESENRLFESMTHQRCVPCATHFLSLKNIYSDKLLDKIMDKSYIEETYGKRNIPKEIFSLDCSIEIEHKEYKGKKLSQDDRRRSAKYLVEHVPNRNTAKKLSAADKLLFDVADTATLITGGNDHVLMDHVLPHFARADVIICKNKSNGQYEKIEGFDTYVLGDIRRPPNVDKYDWYSLVILGWNNVIRNTPLPLGAMLMKKRQLEALGYKTVFIPWCEFLLLTSEQKLEYVKKKINEV